LGCLIPFGLGRLRAFWGLSVYSYAVSKKALFLVQQVGVELAFEVVYVELEFFMLADLVV
jgi:hypothetical protein